MLDAKLNFFKYSEFTKLFVSFLIARVLFAYYLPLGVDEAYQITVGRHLAWSYYDHPALSFWAPSVLSKMFCFENIFLYRLPAIIFGSITLFGLYGIGLLLEGRKAAFWTIVLYILSPFFFFSGGMFVVPDGPLNAAIAMTMFLFIRSQTLKSGYVFQMILIGIWVAISFLSKYHAILLPFSLLFYFLISSERRYWFFHSKIWIIALIGVLGLLPTLIWNYQQGWPSFIFHGGRTNFELSPISFFIMGLGQLIYLLPLTLFLAIWAFFAIKRNKLNNLLIYPASFIILSFNLLYVLGAEGFPHWTMPGWMLSLPLIGILLTQKSDQFRNNVKKLLFCCVIPVWLLIGIAAIHINTGWLTAHLKTAPRWDVTLQFMDWNKFPEKFDQICCDDNIKTIGFLNWVDAGLIGATLKGRYPIRVVGKNPHHFIFMDNSSEPVMGYLLVPALMHEMDKTIEHVLGQSRLLDPNVKFIQSIDVKRGSFDYATVLVFKMLLPKPQIGG